MSYQYILFDLDGTITESAPGILASVEYALKKMGIDVPDRSVLRRFIGPPLMESFQKQIGMTEKQSEEAISCYREYYAEKGIFEGALLDGIQECLKKLKTHQKTVALATSKPELYARKVVEHFGVAQYFDVICGATMDESLVEKPDIIRNALKSLNISEEDRSKVLMIGDRKYDIYGAQINQIASMGVLYGYGDREELVEAGADYLVEKASDIATYILDV